MLTIHYKRREKHIKENNVQRKEELKIKGKNLQIRQRNFREPENFNKHLKINILLYHAKTITVIKMKEDKMRIVINWMKESKYE